MANQLTIIIIVILIVSLGIFLSAGKDSKGGFKLKVGDSVSFRDIKTTLLETFYQPGPTAPGRILGEANYPGIKLQAEVKEKSEIFELVFYYGLEDYEQSAKHNFQGYLIEFLGMDIKNGVALINIKEIKSSGDKY